MKKTFFLPLLILLFSCGNSDEPKTSYSIVKQDLLGKHATYHIMLNDSTRNAKDLISIAYKLKSKSSWDKQFVCFYYLKGSKIGYSVWASVSYLPKCPVCTNEKDPAGNDVEYIFIGMR